MAEIVSDRASKKVCNVTGRALTTGWCGNCRLSSESITATSSEELCTIYHGRVAYKDCTDGRPNVTYCDEVLCRGIKLSMSLRVDTLGFVL